MNNMVQQKCMSKSKYRVSVLNKSVICEIHTAKEIISCNLCYMWVSCFLWSHTLTIQISVYMHTKAELHNFLMQSGSQILQFYREFTLTFHGQWFYEECLEVVEIQSA